MSNVKVKNELSDALDYEAKRIIGSSKPWIPGSRFGKVISSTVVATINFFGVAPLLIDKPVRPSTQLGPIINN